MNKVVEFLEKHVQWLAIALGALFLGWMAWSFVVHPPVKATVGGEQVGPGEVDRRIVAGPVNVLETKMKSTRVPAIDTPKWADQFVKRMELVGLEPMQIAADYLPQHARANIGEGPKGPKVPKGPDIVVTRLPVLPPPTMHEPSAGASNVSPPPAIAAAPPAAPGEEGAVAGTGGAALPAVVKPVANVVGVDKYWVCVPFSTSNLALAKEFSDIKLPAFLHRTAFLRIQLIREEKLPDGTWGKQTTVRTLPFNELKPMPPETAKVADLREYYNWAREHQPEIVQPRFYDVQRGDKWEEPQPGVAPNANVAPPPQGLEEFDPNHEYTPDEVKMMTPEQRRAWQLAQQKKREEERKKKAEDARSRRPPPRGGSSKGGGGGGGGGGARSAMDSQRPPRGDEEQSDDGNDPRRQPPMRPGMGIPPGQSGYPGAAPGAPQAAPAAAAGGSCPTGEWEPSASPDEWFGWAFDDTGEAAKVYRYKIVYSIKNPVWDQPRFSNPPTLSKPFAVFSDKDKTEWTKEIKIPSRTSFYVMSNPQPNSATVKFDVFAWQGGSKKNKSFDVAPGDMIGAPDGEVDYSTGWTLVDMRTDPKEPTRIYVVLADPNGVLSRRDWFTDKDKPELQVDKREAQANANAGNGNGGG